MTEQTKACQECGQPLGAGRSDRKFCNDICRTAFNNKRRNEQTVDVPVDHEKLELQKETDADMAAIEKVYGILISNRIKLFNMYHLYERRIPLEEFHRFGVNLKFYTSEHRDDYFEVVCKMCFDYGYHIKENWVYLTRNPNEIYLV
ncbi:hypothetical protein [Mucilaginibacter defluvii]|uniref:DUF2116 family Zn-ribbon domain-containing protein n=1 Tax=Mucilaginibacter defluvii TaxID=1196019 RepID=A0ABP9FPB0_9SPHI